MSQLDQVAYYARTTNYPVPSTHCPLPTAARPALRPGQRGRSARRQVQQGQGALTYPNPSPNPRPSPNPSSNPSSNPNPDSDSHANPKPDPNLGHQPLRVAAAPRTRRQ
eukprot:scaffold38745_cov45-Phaeocystis_antarctica.AAC.3